MELWCGQEYPGLSPSEINNQLVTNDMKESTVKFSVKEDWSARVGNTASPLCERGFTEVLRLQVICTEMSNVV